MLEPEVTVLPCPEGLALGEVSLGEALACDGFWAALGCAEALEELAAIGCAGGSLEGEGLPEGDGLISPLANKLIRRIRVIASENLIVFLPMFFTFKNPYHYLLSKRTDVPIVIHILGFGALLSYACVH